MAAPSSPTPVVATSHALLERRENSTIESATSAMPHKWKSTRGRHVQQDKWEQPGGGTEQKKNRKHRKKQGRGRRGARRKGSALTTYFVEIIGALASYALASDFSSSCMVAASPASTQQNKNARKCGCDGGAATGARHRGARRHIRRREMRGNNTQESCCCALERKVGFQGHYSKGTTAIGRPPPLAVAGVNRPDEHSPKGLKCAGRCRLKIIKRKNTRVVTTPTSNGTPYRRTARITAQRDTIFGAPEKADIPGFSNAKEKSEEGRAYRDGERARPRLEKRRGAPHGPARVRRPEWSDAEAPSLEASDASS